MSGTIRRAVKGKAKLESNRRLYKITAVTRAMYENETRMVESIAIQGYRQQR
jgi:hypothetical protein